MPVSKILPITVFSLLASPVILANDPPPPFTNIQHAVENVGDQVEALDEGLGDLSDTVDTLSGKVDDLEVALDGVADDLAAVEESVDYIAEEVALLSSTLQLETSVDTQACASGAVQCAADGTGAASSGNHSPFRLFVHVTQNGVPVTGLTLDDFGFDNPFVPAGGGTAVICSETVCTAENRFQANGGLYTLWLDRGPAGNWNAGSYAGSVQVNTTEGGSGAALVTFSITAP